jgi:hypothetical protein
MVMPQECRIWKILGCVTGDGWLCEWTEACAINKNNFTGLKDYETAGLYSATIKMFIEYWMRVGVKVLDMKSDGEEKSMVVRKWNLGKEDSKMEAALNEYNAVVEAIQFVGAASLSDMLTKETVYAGVEYLGISCCLICWIKWK